MNLKINQKLLPLKAHYFLFNAGTAPVVPFMPTLVRQLGFSTVVVGTIYTVLPIVGMLVKPVFGAIADRFRRQKLLFLLFQILTAVAFFLIMFIPPIPQESTVQFHCHNGASDMKFCPENGTRLDDCITNKITNGQQSNTILQCKMNCRAEPWMWEVVCKDWGVKKYCDENNIEDKNNLRFISLIQMEKIELLDSCLFFVIHRGKFDDDQEVPLYCPSNLTNSFKTSCDVTCDNALVMESITTSKIPDSEASGLYQFWLLFLFLIVSWAGMAVVVSVGDAICFEMLGDKPQLYGKQRLWGAVGWGTFSLIAGFLVDKFSEGQSSKNYSIVFYMTLVIITVDMFVSSKLKHSQTKLSSNILKDVGQIFTSLRVIVFFLWCILVGLGTALIWNFLFWHLEDLASLQDGCDHTMWMKTLQGLAMGTQCFGGELPFFFLSGKILKKIGHIHAMSLVLLGFGIRFLLYSALTNPWWVIPIELMQGVTFGIFYSTMASYASIVAPPGTETTIQGLVGAVFEGIGVSCGSLFGGFLFAKIGGSSTFRAFGIGAIICFIIHVILQFVMEKFLGPHGKKMKIKTDSMLKANKNSLEINNVTTSTSSLSVSVKTQLNIQENNHNNGVNGKSKSLDDFKEIDLNLTG